MSSRRILALPLLAAVLLSGCAVSGADPGSSSSASAEPSGSPSASASASPSPSPSETAAAPAPPPAVTPPAASGPGPTAAPGDEVAFTPLTASTTTTDDDVLALLPTAADVPAGWVPSYIDYAAVGVPPQYWPCGPGYWYVTGPPFESSTAFAETEWASSGDVSAPPFPSSLATRIWATPDAASAFERIQADHGACATAGTGSPEQTPTAFPTPAGYDGAVCGGMLYSSDGVRFSRSAFCWATAGELLVSSTYDQTADPQVALTDAEIQAAFAAAFARALG
ncbi:hypothetical protein GCM10009846_17840 [Agrococcus versicolor]|uniref:PknH-like extracellular domain-containing protein n=1 Tax=Agrococcus versicolor TaxID=501482 RepID=A0ABN3ASD8_9MICO